MRSALRAEIVAVGTELLLGDNVDTNSAWISRRLAEVGIDVFRHTSVGDNIGRMTAVLAEATSRAEIVLVTGGLGPTQDDMTRQAVAALAGVDVVRDDAMAAEIAAHFRDRRREMPDNNLQQADLPEGAWWLSRIGTAPGFAIETAGTLVVCMPGVPAEMQAMVESDVMPLLQARAQLATTVSRAVRTSGLSESDIAATLADLVTSLDEAGNPTIAFLASGGETRIKVTAKATRRAEALALAEPVVQQVVALLGEGVVGLDEDGVEGDIGRRLRGAGLTVAVAESITGGAVGARLAGVPGASDWFRGGLITYATDTKALLAGLDPARLAADGPVSAWTAEQLAIGAADRVQADIGVAVVGVAGPTTQADQPIGTVWIGSVGPDGLARSRELRVAGRSRAEIQEFAAAATLTVLHRLVLRLTRA
ncbi:MAG TPA: competence/damage-inducible protein A [Euzebya sp.]|nr:competence/damage-inducible protein A [Euzebya sp.]